MPFGIVRREASMFYCMATLLFHLSLGLILIEVYSTRDRDNIFHETLTQSHR